MSEFKHGTYKYKNKYYKTLPSGTEDGFVLAKNQETREWEASVLYTSNGKDKIYCRELKDFTDKFEYMGS